MMKYTLTEISYGGCEVEWLVEDDGQGNIRKIERLTPTYNGNNGRCHTTVDTTLITADAVITGQIKRQAQAGLTKGKRSQKARVVETLVTEQLQK
ncbi:hypothetical protein ACQCVB_17750 [Fictibacillus phosphorivorans]|uniref:hypothetical protein n=1 Tax=Fictibacillus phosphorivorans TaxID=1221500 RepID=UPI003CF492AA